MKDVHIGERIRQKLKERGLGIAEFAAAIHCNRTNAYSIFSRKSIDIEQLLLISKALDYDFISEVYGKRKTASKYLAIVELDEAELDKLSGFSVKLIKRLSE